MESKDTVLRNADTKDLVEELSDRFSKADISSIKWRMGQEIESEATNSSLSTKEIKRELAKHWLGGKNG